MTEVLVDFPLQGVPKQRAFRLDKSFKDAVGDYLKWRWPHRTAKEACKAFAGLTLDQAKKAAAYDCSATTLELIVKRGGPEVFLPILEEVWGGSLAHYFIEKREHHVATARRFAALVRDLGAQGADRDPAAPDPTGAGGELADEPRVFARGMGGHARRRTQGGDQ